MNRFIVLCALVASCDRSFVQAQPLDNNIPIEDLVNMANEPPQQTTKAPDMFGDWMSYLNPSKLFDPMSLFSMAKSFTPWMSMLTGPSPALAPVLAPSRSYAGPQAGNQYDYDYPQVATGEKGADGQPVYRRRNQNRHRIPNQGPPVFNYQPANEKQEIHKHCSRFLSIRGLFAEACSLIVDQRLPFEELMYDSIKTTIQDLANKLNILNRLAPFALKETLLSFAKLFCSAMEYDRS